MSLINFYRGNASLYSKDDMADGVFFTSDKNMLFMNGEEFGSYPKSFSFVSEGSTIEKEILCENYSPNQKRFYFTTTVDLASYEYLEATIDLSTSTSSEGINVLSIGADISGWNQSTLWFFFKKDKFSSGDNFMIQFGTHTYNLTIDTSSPTVISVKNDGVYINDDKKVGSEYGISYLKSLDKWMVGSYRADDEPTLSDATYNRISVYEKIGSDGVTMTYMANKSEKKTIELPLATTTSNGVMSYKDKQILDSFTGDVDGGTY